MGGITTDLDGRSTLRGLYAAGETACTGVHGANRLASNSLLEGLVFGARAANAMRNQVAPASTVSCPPRSRQQHSHVAEIARQLRNAMWEHAGVVRNGSGLRKLGEQIEYWEKALAHASSREEIETRNLLAIGELISHSALTREESRGAHFRSDCPQRDDARFRKHSTVFEGRIYFE